MRYELTVTYTESDDDGEELSTDHVLARVSTMERPGALVSDRRQLVQLGEPMTFATSVECPTAEYQERLWHVLTRVLGYVVQQDDSRLLIGKTFARPWTQADTRMVEAAIRLAGVHQVGDMSQPVT